VTVKKKLGRKGKKRRKAISATALIKILEIPRYFAPSVEDCPIKYKLTRMGKSKLDMAKLVIKDKDGNVIYDDGGIMSLIGDGTHTTKWDGKDKNGKYVSPLLSPFTVSIVMTKNSKINDKRKVRVEIKEIYLWIDSSHNKLIMDNPERKVGVVTTVHIKKSDGSGSATAIPIDVVYSFTIGANNTLKADSFNYKPGDATKYLGKKGDPNAIYWENHAECTSTSSDSYKNTCKVTTKISTPDLGKAKIWIKPSGVGGDELKLQAKVYAADGSTELKKKETEKLVVWRKINYTKVYTMSGENYIDAATTRAQIAPAFEGDGHFLYSRSAVITLNATLTVKYIGLYKSGGGSKIWPGDFSPQKLESSPFELRPTASELSDYAYSGTDGPSLVKKATAKTKIETKAQKWFNSIVREYNTSVNDWFADAGIPSKNTLCAVRYYHPKLSGLAEGATNFWPAGISINMANPGSGLNTPGDPDQATWREVQGFNRGSISVIFKNYGTAARLQIVCRHEIGHATRDREDKADEYKRKEFGVGDHSVSGLMTPYGASNTFSNTDIKILRGRIR